MNKIYSITFISSLIESIEKKDTALVSKELLRKLVVQDDNICEIIYKCIKNEVAIDSKNRKLMITVINDTNVDRSNYDGWMLAFYIIMHTGNFDVAFSLRENAKKYLYKRYFLKDFDNDGILLQLLSLALEDGKDELYLEIKEKISNIHSHFETDTFDTFHSFCTGDIIKLRRDSLAYNEDFYNYINNKKVSIIAPTTVESFDAKEIDSSDVVVRLNYSSKGQGCDPIHKGTRTNISYYNNVTIGKIKAEYNGVAPNDLDFIVTKKTFEFENIKNKSGSLFDRVLLNGAFNLLPNALFDLLMFSPKEIKIFHSDLQIKPALRVENYYTKGSVFNDDESHKKNVAKSFSVHDPFGQLELLKRIVRNNTSIIVDEMLSDVINMSPMDYAYELTENYKPDPKNELLIKLDELSQCLEKQEILLTKKEQKIKKQENKILILNEKVKKQQDSLSWKITYPLRFLNKKINSRYS